MQTVISWNVNGIRAAQRHGFLDWLALVQPDICCVQETKANPDQLDDALLNPPGYTAAWCSAERKGYSGVAIFSKFEPVSVSRLGVPEFDCEGRVQITEFPAVTIVNAYFPNSQEKGARIDYKVAFCNALLDRCNALRSEGRNLLVCGDFNIAHKPIDLKNPKQNEQNPGYLPEERAWMDTFIDAGYVDTFRMFNQEPGHYTWWTYRFNARAKDVGWRIDYHCVNAEFRKCVSRAEILKDIMGSDHCPVLVELAVE